MKNDIYVGYMQLYKILQIINTLFFTSSCILFGIGCSLLPQTVTNNGNAYIGTAEAYNTDLHNAQMNSYGFKLIMVGVGIFGGSFISCVAVCYLGNKEEDKKYIGQQQARVAPIMIEIADDNRKV
jgi:hypothetical protein